MRKFWLILKRLFTLPQKREPVPTAYTIVEALTKAQGKYVGLICQGHLLQGRVIFVLWRPRAVQGPSKGEGADVPISPSPSGPELVELDNQGRQLFVRIKDISAVEIVKGKRYPRDVRGNYPLATRRRAKLC